MLFLHPDFHIADTADQFHAILSLQGEVYRQQPGRRTLRFEHHGKSYFAKIHTGIGWKEIFKNLLQGRLPVLGADNEWRAIRRLQQLNILTPTIMAYGKKGLNPARLQSFLITSALTNTISLEDLCRHWRHIPPKPAIKRTLIKAVASIARHLHEHGINHRDFYICHFLLDTSMDITQVTPTNVRLYLIDLHRAQIRKKTPTRWVIKDLSGLYFSSMEIGLTQRDQLRFIKNYCGKSLREVFQKNNRFWHNVARRAKKLFIKDKHRFIQLRTPRYRIVCEPYYFSPALQSLLLNLDQAFHAQSTVSLKKGDTTSVALVTIDNRQFVIKRYNLISRWHRFKRFFKPTRAKKCWENAHHLLRHNILTAKPVAFVEERWGPFSQKAYYLTEYIPGIHANDFFQKALYKNHHSEVAKKITALLTKLFKKHTSHGDMKATNILIKDNQPLFIDLDSMRQHRFIFRFKKAKKRDIHRFFKNWRNLPDVAALFKSNDFDDNM